MIIHFSLSRYNAPTIRGVKTRIRYVEQLDICINLPRCRMDFLLSTYLVLKILGRSCELSTTVT